MNRAVFLDRDGVINPMVYDEAEGVFDSPYHPNKFELFPMTAEAIKIINVSGMLAIVISNQPGVAKGKCTMDTINVITEKMHQELSILGARLDKVYYCFHHPQAIIPEFRMVCSCRKPEPGMLLKAAKECSIDLKRSYMIGDTEKDIGAGTRAGCKTILIRSPSEHRDGSVESNQKAQMVASNLLDAILHMLGLEK